MKRITAIVGAVLGLTAGLSIANPLPLQGRDINGNAVGAADASAVFEYDPNLNLTWLRDWNYAKTSGYPDANRPGMRPGQFKNWDAARTWASNLTVGGFSGWSLPAVTDTGVAGCANHLSYVGTDCGYSVYGYGTNSPGAASLSPMAYLWYVELGNKPYRDTSGNYPQPDWGLKNPGPFINMVPGRYWSDTEHTGEWIFGTPPPGGAAWTFITGDGMQEPLAKYYDNMYAVAVRSGDVCTANCNPVPVPATIALLGLGLVGIAAARRKQS